MKLEKTPGGYALYKEKTIIGTCQTRPLKQCTALVCGFANWADTAPLPCFLLKK